MQKDVMDSRSNLILRCALGVMLIAFLGNALAESSSNTFPSWLTEEEKSFLSKSPILRVGLDPYFPPIEYLDPDKGHQGISVDFLSEIERILPVHLEYANEKSWKNIIKKTQDREIDILGAAAETPQRTAYLNFTKPYLTFPAVILTRQNEIQYTTMAELAGKRVGVTRGYAVHEYVQSHFPQLSLEPVNSIDEGLNLLSYGQLDAMVCINAPALYYLEKNGLTNLHVAGKSGYFLKLAIASRNDEPLLGSILAKALDHIPDNKKNAILSKWINRPEAQPWQPGALIVAVILFVLGSLAFMGSTVWTRTLRHRITRATEKQNEKIMDLEASRCKLEISKELFRNAFDHAHVALILYELDGTVIDMNQLALKLFGIERSALQLVTLRELLAPELIDIEKITEYWEKALNFDEQEFYLVGRNIQTEKTFEVCVHLARMKLASQNNILATIQRRQN